MPASSEAVFRIEKETAAKCGYTVIHQILPERRKNCDSHLWHNMRQTYSMTATRYKSSWMWLAVAAMAVMSLTRVEGSIGNATVYTNPVLAFLAGQQNANSTHSAPTGGPQILNLGSARKRSLAFLHDAAPGAWTAILPVLFIGLVAPLSLISPKSYFSLGRRPAAPLLPCSFQRPPPALL